MSRIDAILATLMLVLIVIVVVGFLVISAMDIADFEDEFGSYDPQTELDNVMDNWENPEAWPTPDGYQAPK